MTSTSAAVGAASYSDLLALPDHVVGEIVNDELTVTPRPSPVHARAASRLGMKLGGPFDLGDGGPGGWWILDEPEVHLGQDVVVPDLAGWRRQRMPRLPEGPWLDLAPDWLCEILSPSTARHDRTVKLPVYAREGVHNVWLIDPVVRTLEVLRLRDSVWMVVATHGDDTVVRAEPFAELELDLLLLWGESRPDLEREEDLDSR